MRCRHHYAQGTDNDEDEKAKARLDQAVSLQMAYCHSGLRPVIGPLDKSQGQSETVVRGDPYHGGEESDFYKQNTPVDRADQFRDRPHEKPSIDDPGDEKRSDADNAESREAQRRPPCDRGPRRVASPSSMGIEKRKR